ncbi:MAG: hypothetical protein JWN86_373 [Planctomycetota bacterium]|nr:hypothetical protein [Planctomycetota bacterium]
MPIIRTMAISALLVVTASAGEVRLNQIQVIGTHNSYHIAPGPEVMRLIATGGQERANAINYSHVSLSDQFSAQGIRQIELDVFADRKGGLFADPAMRKIVRTLGKDPGPDPDQAGVLRKPGMKVLHLPDVDFLTTVPSFAAALSEVRAWSESNARHVPILILVELKDEIIPGIPTRPDPFDKGTIASLEAEILASFPRSHLLVPDDVRGEFATLPEAIKGRGWPTMDSLRGKVMFALDNEGRHRDLYLDGHDALRGRLMFASAPGPEHPAAAWFKINDPTRDFERIRDLVRRGFLVRTRADADTVEARKNDGSRRDRALASGAQYISTDFPVARRDFSSYRVRLPADMVARWNPVLNPDDAPTGDLEGPLPKKR